MRYLQILVVLVVVGYVIYDFVDDADRDASGNIISEGEIDVFAVRVGDCFNDSKEMLDAEASDFEIQNLTGLPCSKPHDNEVYAVFDVSLEKFPGDTAMYEMATGECLEHFQTFVGRPYEESKLAIFPMHPTADSWSRLNDRGVVCAAYHVDGEKLTGSVKHSGI